MRKVAKEDAFGTALAKLRGHLKKCAECRLMLKGGDITNMCEEGIILTHRMIVHCTQLATLHRKATMATSRTVYACPDPSKHGTSYKATATPMLVTAYQEPLF